MFLFLFPDLQNVSLDTWRAWPMTHCTSCLLSIKLSPALRSINRYLVNWATMSVCLHWVHISDVRLLHFSLGEPHRAVQKLQERLWDPECAVQPNGKKQYSVYWHRGCGMYAGSGDKQTFSKWEKRKLHPLEESVDINRVLAQKLSLHL